MSAVLGVSALAACSSATTPAPSTENAAAPTEPAADGEDDTTPPDDSVPATTKDGGASTKDSGTKPKDGGAPVDTGPKPFSKSEIQTLFNTRCAPCHIANASGAMSLAGDFTTTTVGVSSTQVPSMKRIAPGDKEASYLFHKLGGTHLTVGGAGVRMPKSGPPYLSDADIARIGAFIDAL